MSGYRFRFLKSFGGLICAFFLLLILIDACGNKGITDTGGPSLNDYTVLAYNDLGMHCMNQSFAEYMILPPYNNLHAQVIDRRNEDPRIVTGGIQISYSVPGNTISSTKTDFWDYVQVLLGVSPAPNIGLSGNGLAGQMSYTGSGDWEATGIPLTPLDDSQQENPYQLALVTVTDNNGLLDSTMAVVPVSWEISCDLCHHGPPDAPASVLEAHDNLHGTNLYNPDNQTPIACGNCHAQPELGLPGNPDLNNLSRAMHGSHASRMNNIVGQVPDGIVCYACHPGIQTQCLRDIHAANQMNCMDCHAGGTGDIEAAMQAIATPGRRPWVDEPRCGNCHNVSGHEYEQAGTLFRNSRGHGGIFCEACHNTPHAIAPTENASDNWQALHVQNEAGTINRCAVCHKQSPDESFIHRFFIEELN